MNITKITNGFIVDGIPLERIFLDGSEVEINSETMCHIPTQTGILYFDTSATIDGESFENIQSWIDKLYS